MSVWNQKGSALSDKSARKEFELTQEEIIDGIRRGKLQYKQNYIHGNPYFRLLRIEVESLVAEKYGKDSLKKKNLVNELSKINQEIRKLKKQLKNLEEKKVQLVGSIGD